MIYNICLQARRALGDFGVVIAMLLMVLLDFSIKSTYTQVSNKNTSFYKQ